EHHRERAVAQGLVDLVALEPVLDPARAREEVRELVGGKVLELQEVLCDHRHLSSENGATQAPFSRCARRQASALMACASRAFVRDTIFLCTTFLSAIRSITACDSVRVLAAAALSPEAIALRTFLTAVRSSDFWLAFAGGSLPP